MLGGINHSNLEGVRTARAKVGLESTRENSVPEVGTLLWTKDSHKLYIGDGVTPGGILYEGIPIDKESLLELFVDMVKDPDFAAEIAQYLNIEYKVEVGNLFGGTF